MVTKYIPKSERTKTVPWKLIKTDSGREVRKLETDELNYRVLEYRNIEGAEGTAEILLTEPVRSDDNLAVMFTTHERREEEERKEE